MEAKKNMSKTNRIVLSTKINLFLLCCHCFYLGLKIPTLLFILLIIIRKIICVSEVSFCMFLYFIYFLVTKTISVPVGWGFSKIRHKKHAMTFQLIFQLRKQSGNNKKILKKGQNSMKNCDTFSR